MHNDFPKPSIPLPTPLPSTIDPEVVASTPPPIAASQPEQPEDLPDADEDDAPPNSQSSTKENDEPADIVTRPPVPSFGATPTTPQRVQPPDSIETQAGVLPPDLLSSYQASTRVLGRDFSESPPHTIQRLAELVLEPTKHYRFLPSYLRALDRVISVSSPSSEFPLPSLQANTAGGFLTNGDSSQTNGIAEKEGLGSDESLGGALLTPIPWLPQNSLNRNSAPAGQDGELHSESTETIEGPNGAGTIETVTATVNGVYSSPSSSVAQQSPSASPTLSEQSDASTSSSTDSSTDAQLRQQGAVTQGELLRQEQEAGIVPISQPAPRRTLMAGGAVAVGRESASAAAAGVPRDTAEDISMDDRPAEDTPHARGPDVIGMEDMGPQHHAIGSQALDMEAAVGRAKSPPSDSPVLPNFVLAAPEAEAMAREAEQNHDAEPGRDPQDREKAEAKAREEDERAKEAQARDGDGDVVVADAEGNPVGAE